MRECNHKCGEGKKYRRMWKFRHIDPIEYVIWKSKCWIVSPSWSYISETGFFFHSMWLQLFIIFCLSFLGGWCGRETVESGERSIKIWLSNSRFFDSKDVALTSMTDVSWLSVCDSVQWIILLMPTMSIYITMWKELLQ